MRDVFAIGAESPLVSVEAVGPYCRTLPQDPTVGPKRWGAISYERGIPLQGVFAVRDVVAIGEDSPSSMISVEVNGLASTCDGVHPSPATLNFRP